MPVFRQATFHLVELFRQATFYLVELFRQATFYLAELFRQITSPNKKRIPDGNKFTSPWLKWKYLRSSLFNLISCLGGKHFSMLQKYSPLPHRRKSHHSVLLSYYANLCKEYKEVENQMDTSPPPVLVLMMLMKQNLFFCYRFAILLKY